MCKSTNNFTQAAGGAGKATDVHPKSSSILLGSESSSSRFKLLSKEKLTRNKVSSFSHAAGAAKKNTCLDQKSSSVSLGCESSSNRFTPLPDLSKGVGQPAGAAKKKKPAHFIEIDQPGILLGTEGSKSRFSADSDVDKKSANPLFIGVCWRSQTCCFCRPTGHQHKLRVGEKWSQLVLTQDTVRSWRA